MVMWMNLLNKFGIGIRFLNERMTRIPALDFQSLPT
jgi:hypothetical protein